MNDSALRSDLGKANHGQPDRERVAMWKPASWPSLANWDKPPYSRWSFQNMSQLFPTAVVSRGTGQVCEFARRQRGLGQISVTRLDGSIGVVQDILAETYTDGFLVLHGRVR